MTDPHDLPVIEGIRPIPLHAHVIIAAWVPDHGWLITRQGISHAPNTSLTSDDFTEAVAFVAKAGARAMQHRYREEVE